jgi:hypothetical protein
MKNESQQPQVCSECKRPNGEHEEWCSIGRNWLPENVKRSRIAADSAKATQPQEWNEIISDIRIMLKEGGTFRVKVCGWDLLDLSKRLDAAHNASLKTTLANSVTIAAFQDNE